MKKRMINHETIKTRAKMLKELHMTTTMTREQIGDALFIPIDEGLLHKHLLAMLPKKDVDGNIIVSGFIDRTGTPNAKGKSGTKGNPYQYFILPNGVAVLHFLGII